MKKLIPLVIIAFVWLVSYTAHVMPPFTIFPWMPLLITEICVGCWLCIWLIERKK